MLRPAKRRKPQKPSVQYTEKGRSVENYEPYIDLNRGLTPDKYDTICSNVRTRCYNEHFHEANPEYTECEMCDEWLQDREEFVRWIYDNYYTLSTGENMQIDKDIKVKHNKIYSPDTCIFVPRFINSFFRPDQGRRNKKTDLPIGVRLTQSGKYTSSIRPFDKKRVVTLGTFETPEEAWIAYNSAKIMKKEMMLDFYKPVLPQEVYEYCMAYEFEITD